MKYRTLAGDYSEKTGALFVPEDELPLGNLVDLLKIVSPTKAAEAAENFKPEPLLAGSDELSVLRGKVLRKAEREFKAANTFHKQALLAQKIEDDKNNASKSAAAPAKRKLTAAPDPFV